VDDQVGAEANRPILMGFRRHRRVNVHHFCELAIAVVVQVNCDVPVDKLASQMTFKVDREATDMS
jgi:hypothetical protein